MIFNIGNPDNCVSIGELAAQMVRIAREFPELRSRAERAAIVPVTSDDYYGKYYQDIQVRVPAIEAARQHLGWKPTTGLEVAIRKTIDYYMSGHAFDLAETGSRPVMRATA
jgi:nucleoside-diphosphate-sugar epimerase